MHEVQNSSRTFNIYPSGKITKKGRVASSIDGFKMLKPVADKIQEVEDDLRPVISAENK